MSRYWFKPKRYGLGAAPSSWQGWALTFGYVLAMFGLSGWFATSGGDHVVAFLVIVTALTIIFAGIAWRTTEGGWRWRWGDDT